MAILKQALLEPATAGTHLQHLKHRSMVLQLGDERYDFPSGNESIQAASRRIGAVLQKATALLPNSYLELQSVRRDLHWHGDCFGIAPYGVD